MRWYAAVEMTGDLTDDDIMDIAEDKPTSIDYDSHTRAAEVRLTVDTDNYAQAVRQAVGTFVDLANVQRLIATGRLSQPHRFVVQDEHTEEQSLGILSTAAVAERLGVSTARVRQLKDEPDFPRSFKIPGAAGDFYYTADVDAYAARRKPGSQAQGKPRAGDEELLNTGLRAILDGFPIPYREQETAQRALAATGGGSVSGKARVLVDLFDRLPIVAVEDWSVAALRRAREICRS